MDYQIFKPDPNLASLVKLYWTLVVPAAPDHERQRILPDGCVEMIFILGDDVKRFTSENEYVLQPRAMILGQISKPFFIQPTGYVKTFAVRFYPYGFAALTDTPLSELTNKDTALSVLFGEEVAEQLQAKIIHADDTLARISIIEKFLFDRLKKETVINEFLKTVVNKIMIERGSKPVNLLLASPETRRRQLERNFAKQVGLSPKKLCKVIRLQAALQMMRSDRTDSLTSIAYEAEYFDQAHFSKDFKDITGVSPKDFFSEAELALSAKMYTKP